MDIQGSIPSRGRDSFLFITASRSALRPTQPPIHWVSEDLFQGIKCLGYEADHPPPSSGEIKNVLSYTFTPPIHHHSVVLN
jgi:hypothetical protein